MWWRALLTAVLVVAAYPLPSNLQELKVGTSLDIFPRYGYLSLTMKVVPKDESDFIFKEPTIDIFTNLEPYTQRTDRIPKNHKRVFAGEFHMEFCDNVGQLLQAYFRDFTFERLDNPWKAFTSSWGPELMAKYLGITSNYVNKDHCFVLVRLSRFRDSVRLTKPPDFLNLTDEVAKDIDGISVGNVTDVDDFIKTYGTHYIDSYVTGNSLYQVFVFNQTNYKQLKERLKTQGIARVTITELNQFFSPWHAEHMGVIKVASGNKTVEKWAATKLLHRYFIFAFPSLLKIHGDPKLLSKLNVLLRNEAILEMQMKTLAPAFKDPRKRAWFEEVLDYFLRLWESNM